MQQAEQEQRDNLALPSELTGGASSSQGPLPPKQPRTPKSEAKSEAKSEMKSESEATPKVKKRTKRETSCSKKGHRKKT